MAVDIFNTDGIADPTGIVKHGSIIMNAGVIPSRIIKGNDAVFNLPVIDDIQEKYDARWDDPLYYKLSGGLILATNEYYATSTAVDRTEPVAIAAKFKVDSILTGTSQTLCGLCSTSSINLFRLLLRANDAEVAAQARRAALGQTSQATVVAGQTHIAIGMFTSDTDRDISLDGDTYANNATNVAITASNIVIIGANTEGATKKDGFAGEIIWVCVWGGSVALTQGDATAIGTGTDPLTIQNSDITFYQDFSEGINGASAIGPVLGSLQTF